VSFIKQSTRRVAIALVASFHEYLVKNRLLGDEDEINELSLEEDEKIIDELVKRMKQRHPDVNSKKDDSGLFMMARFKSNKRETAVFPWLCGVEGIQIDVIPSAFDDRGWEQTVQHPDHYKEMVKFNWPKIPYDAVIDKVYKILTR
jgi:hypothetical protein